MVPEARTPPLWDAIAVVQQAFELFGTWEEVCHWLLGSKRALDGARPIDLLDSEEGCDRLLTLINAIETGAVL